MRWLTLWWVSRFGLFTGRVTCAVAVGLYYLSALGKYSVLIFVGWESGYAGCEGEVGQPHRVPSTRVYTKPFGTDSNDRARSSDPINSIVLSCSGPPNKSLWKKYFFAWVALRG